jgi:CBS domain-containing protein
VTGGDGQLSLFVHRVRDFLRGPVTTCAPATSVADLAALMERAGAAVVVASPDGTPLGIVTDRDLRLKVVAARRDAARTPAGDVMSAPLRTVAPDAFAFEALLEMTRLGIHHLAVAEGGRVTGLLSSDDLLTAQAVHPVTLARDIAQAASRTELFRCAGGITSLVQRLFDDGGRMEDVARIVAELNDRLVVKVLAQAEAALAERGEGRPPVPYGWLVFGSEARREQTLRTDQDNGLVYADPSPERAPAAARYFAALADEAIAALIAIGFPPCPGGAMASNPRWCQPLSTWQAYFHEWMSRPTPQHVLAASMYFDLRHVVGAPALGESLTTLLREEAPRQRRFLTAMASDVVDRRLPVGLFGGVRVARRGPHRGAVDLKGAGGLQLVGAARIHALELGLAETGTAERFLAAGDRGIYAPADARQIVDAFEDLLRLRLEHQLACVSAGRPPDNYVQLDRLSRRDDLLLREALRTAGRVQARLRERFATDFAG